MKMELSLKEKIRLRKEQKEQEKSVNITDCTSHTSSEIMEAYLPKTKTRTWYLENCIGDDRIPYCAINGHPGGKPFYTKDRKIMRSGATTWEELGIRPCESK
jgi:hypothetical protein